MPTYTVCICNIYIYILYNVHTYTCNATCGGFHFQIPAADPSATCLHGCELHADGDRVLLLQRQCGNVLSRWESKHNGRRVQPKLQRVVSAVKWCCTFWEIILKKVQKDRKRSTQAKKPRTSNHQSWAFSNIQTFWSEALKRETMRNPCYV